MNTPFIFRFAAFCLLLPGMLSAQVFTKTFSAGDTLTNQAKCYNARHIYFKLDKADLLEASNPMLDSMAAFLKRNDSLVVQIGVHGSTRNAATSCNKITQNRAMAIGQYLTDRGVSQQRLVCKGYGQTHLLYTDAEINKVHDKKMQDVLHQKNRRIEFVILRSDFKMGK